MKRAILVLALVWPVGAQVDPALLDRLAAQFHPSDRAFSFAAIGDQQYGAEGERKWPALQASINQAKGLQFVVHAGDIKNGNSVCSDALFQDRYEWFNKFKTPLILTPGDNEWTDCHRTGGDPVERLSKLRQMFFAGDESLGQKRRKLTRQDLYPENALWTEGGMVFATVHIVGSDNNSAVRDEYEARNRATLDWMRTAFALGKRNRFGGIVLVMQADPFFPLSVTRSVQRVETTPGFVDTLRVLEEETVAFGRPVLVINGDSHFFRFDKPMAHTGSKAVVDNFFRLEVPGEEDAHWVRVDVDPETPESPFRVQHMTVKANAR
jgi:hypothetical protein